MSTHIPKQGARFWSRLALLLVVCSFLTVSLVLIPEESSAQSGDTIVISGKVTYATDGAEIEGATLKVYAGSGAKYKRESDEKGHYSFTVPKGDDYIIQCLLDDHKTQTRNLGYLEKSTGADFSMAEKPWDTILMEVLEGDDMLQGIGLIGLFCFIISLPIARNIGRTRQVEDNIPDVLTEVAANIRSANSVESSFRDVAMVRTDYTGRLLQVTCQRMNETSFSQAMQEFAIKTRSLAVQRIVSLINIAIESGASIADVLDKISDELSSLYALRREKENKSATNAVIILWGGVIFTPGIIGFILGFFNSGAAVPMDDAIAIIQIFMIFFAAECAFMHAVAMGSMKLDMIRTPFYMFLAQLIYVVTLYASPALM